MTVASKTGTVRFQPSEYYLVLSQDTFRLDKDNAFVGGSTLTVTAKKRTDAVSGVSAGEVLITVVPDSGTTGTSTSGSLTYAVTSSMKKITVTLTDPAKTVTHDQRTVMVVKDGAGSLSYSIQCNADVIRKATDGTFDPSILTWIVVKSDGSTLTRLETLSACVAEGLTLKYMRNTDSSMQTIQETLLHTILPSMTSISLYVYKADVAVAEKTVKVVSDGTGPSFYMAGTYSSTTSYTRDAFGAPVVQLDGLYYGQKKVGTIKGINPKTDVANNGGNWGVFDMFKYIFTEVAFILFGKLGSAIFNGDFMFSQHGVNSSGVANQNYTAFNPSLADPTTNASFMPNILLNLFTGKAWFRDAVIGGSLTARALKRKVAHGGSGAYTSLTDCSGFYLDGDFSMPVLSEDTFMDLHGMVLQPEVRTIVATGTIFFPSSDNTVYYNGLVYSGVRYLKYQHSGGFIKVQFHGTSPSGYNNCWFIQVESSLEFTFTVELYS